MNTPIFTISLDFELHWGRFDKTTIQGNENYYLQTREVIPEILRLFEEFQVEATWATVGMLFAKDTREWEKYGPVEKPAYVNKSLSAYHWFNTDPSMEPFLFAPELIGKILRTHGQELGSHSFSHYYTLAEGQTENQFRQDLQAAQRIAWDKFGVNLCSLVFPRNHFNSEYLKICHQEGFSIIRSNPLDWYWKSARQERLMKKIFRTGDALIPLGKKSTFSLSDIVIPEDLPIMFPASRFLRPYHQFYPALNRWKLNRVKNEMHLAAQEGEVYHLWWHPHNYGNNPDKSLEELRVILVYFDSLRLRYGMQSRNLKNLGEMVRKGNDK
jgi:hypothetical protein